MARTRRLGSIASAGALLAGVLVAREAFARAREVPLTGKTVLIVGGSRGLGLLLARRCAAEGARVAISARDQETLKRAASWLADHGNDVLTVACDASDPGQAVDLVKRTEARLGPIDVLVNSAAVMQVGEITKMTLEDFRQAHDSAFWATLMPVVAVLPAMRQRGSGQIVNITSIGGRVPGPHLAPYTAAKFAAVGLSEALHIELARHNIAVTTVVPWFMRTGSYLNAIYKEPAEAEFSWFALGASLPLISLDADRAAARIVQAVKRREVDVALGWPAWLAQRVHGLFPGLTAQLTAAATTTLPSTEGHAQAGGTPGVEVEQRVPAVIEMATAWGREAARALNEPV